MQLDIRREDMLACQARASCGCGALPVRAPCPRRPAGGQGSRPASSAATPKLAWICSIGSRAATDRAPRPLHHPLGVKLAHAGQDDGDSWPRACARRRGAGPRAARRPAASARGRPPRGRACRSRVQAVHVAQDQHELGVRPGHLARQSRQEGAPVRKARGARRGRPRRAARPPGRRTRAPPPPGSRQPQRLEAGASRKQPVTPLVHPDQPAPAACGPVERHDQPMVRPGVRAEPV